MNRVLYQLSYAAMYGQANFGVAEISFLIIYSSPIFVKIILGIFPEIFGNASFEVIDLKFWKYPLYFLLGGAGYVGLELLWRGHSHWTMFLAGGICFLLLGQLSRLPWPPACTIVLGACMITSVELLLGLLFNRSYTIWDYRHMPLNLLGQVCVPFTLLWVPVSFGAILLYRLLDRQLQRRPTSRK